MLCNFKCHTRARMLGSWSDDDILKWLTSIVKSQFVVFLSKKFSRTRTRYISSMMKTVEIYKSTQRVLRVKKSLKISREKKRRRSELAAAHSWKLFRPSQLEILTLQANKKYFESHFVVKSTFHFTQRPLLTVRWLTIGGSMAHNWWKLGLILPWIRENHSCYEVTMSGRRQKKFDEMFRTLVKDFVDLENLVIWFVWGYHSGFFLWCA